MATRRRRDVPGKEEARREDGSAGGWGHRQGVKQERKLDKRRAEDSTGEGRKSLKTFQDKRVVRIRESKNILAVLAAESYCCLLKQYRQKVTFSLVLSPTSWSEFLRDF